MKVGYGEDITGNAIVKFEIVAETTDNRYVIKREGILWIRNKDDIKDIKEE